MKKFLFVMPALLFSAGLFAQEQTSKEDTLRIKFGKSKIWIFPNKEAAQKDSIKKERKAQKKFTHWRGIDLGVGMLTTADNKFRISDENDTTQINNFLNLNYSRSIFFSLNLIEKHLRIYKNYVNVLTGLGMEWNSYDFKKSITLAPNAPYISASNTTLAPDSLKFIKDKLNSAYFKAPLLVELNTNTRRADKSFHISGGLEFGYKVSSRTKQVYEIDGYTNKIKRRADYNLTDFKYSAVVRAGYGNYFNVFVNYGLSTVFSKDKGPEIFPLTAGISISF